MKNIKNQWWIAGFAAAFLLAGESVKAGMITHYEHNNQKVVVFSLSEWNGSPVGATNLTSEPWTPGSWSVPVGVTTVDVLVVGGGGGGMGGGGGGAGGGFYGATGLGVTPGTEINVTVGAGGAAAKRPADTGTYPNGGAAETGGQSEFGSLIAFGGQGGAFIWTSSGWGAAYGGTSGTNNQNAIGGIVADGGDYGSGSGVGVKGIVGEGAAGGAGLSSMITGGTTWYGGGGGEMRNGAGGLGGGGAGSSVLSWNGSSGNAGTANTGGGGGAGYGSDVFGGNGGTGIVIVAYQAIPEPSTCALVGIALVPLFFRRNRKSC